MTRKVFRTLSIIFFFAFFIGTSPAGPQDPEKNPLSAWYTNQVIVKTLIDSKKNDCHMMGGHFATTQDNSDGLFKICKLMEGNGKSINVMGYGIIHDATKKNQLETHDTTVIEIAGGPNLTRITIETDPVPLDGPLGAKAMFGI